MGPLDRLQQLFAQDEAILKINTRLRTVAKAPEIPAADESPSAPSDDIEDRLAQLEASKVEEDGGVKLRSASETTPPVYSDGTFCPLMVLSRFPYHHIQGDLMQKVASKFFDKGQFWERSWDLFYIHAPPRLGGRPLVLVSMAQVRNLLREVNTAFNCTLSLPSEEEKGLVLRFDREEFPQPTFLGHSDSRSTKDFLESSIPQKCGYNVSSGDMDEHFMAFEKMMEAAVCSTKSKSKTKAKKQRLRLQRDMEMGETVKRAQCYLGLRAYDAFDELIECKWDEQPHIEPKPPRLTVEKPVPYPFWREPVFISVDVESNERCHTQVTEVGISTLDTRDLIGVAPGPQGQEWQLRIQSRHLRVREHRSHVNHLYIRGCPHRFEFGDSEWVSAAELSSTVKESFSRATFFDGPKKTPRPLVLVGHNLTTDIQYLQLMNVQIVDATSGTSMFADHIDTAESFRIIRGDLEPRSLGTVLGEFGMTGWNLHNAGNDARYTMQVLVAMLVKNSIEQTSVSANDEAGTGHSEPKS